MELEQDGQLPYLDILLIRSRNEVVTNWYRKPTSANITLNFYSNHPLQMKRNVAYNLLYRATTLCDERFRDENINIARQILMDNNYHSKVIAQQIHRLTNRTNAAPIANVNVEPRFRRCLTYDGQISDVLAKEIQTRSDNRLQVLSKPHTSLQRTVFTKLKTPIDTLHRTNVVYEFPCDGKHGEKCDLRYVGQTKNQLAKRLAQHKNDLKSSKPNGQSAVVSHFEEKGHFPAFDKAKILGTESFYSRRNTLESLNICSRPTYNLRRDTDGIAASYVALLERRNRNRNESLLHDTRA